MGYVQIRKITSLKVVLAAPPEELEDMQVYWLSLLSDVLVSLERGRKLEILELEITGFEEVAQAYFGEELLYMQFVALERFTSLTIPHDILTPFLSQQSSLRSLDVGDAICGERCPLNLENLKSLCSVRCAGSCVSSIIPRKPVHQARVIDSARSRIDHASFLGVFVALRASSANLARLEITFPSTEMGILRLVASAAPLLDYLSLIEIEDRPVRDFPFHISSLLNQL